MPFQEAIKAPVTQALSLIVVEGFLEKDRPGVMTQ